jgi:hydroxymethylbilane synthase
MKDVPTQLAQGIVQTAVLLRASYKDIFVYNKAEVPQDWLLNDATYTQPATTSKGVIGTSSIRRKAQWLHRYPHHQIENLRGNVNTRLQKVAESQWHGAIFAAAGLERIGLRPSNAVELDWMLPAPAQGAIMIASLANNTFAQEATALLNHAETALCTKIERDFLHTLMGGCSTPISALAEINEQTVTFRGNIFTTNGSKMVETTFTCAVNEAADLGIKAANNLLQKGAKEIVESIRYAQ